MCLSVRLLSVVCQSLFSFMEDYLGKFEWIYTNLVCTLIFRTSVMGLLMGNFRKFLTGLFASNIPYFHFRTVTCVNINEFSLNLVCALILWRSGLGFLMGIFL